MLPLTPFADKGRRPAKSDVMWSLPRAKIMAEPWPHAPDSRPQGSVT